MYVLVQCAAGEGDGDVSEDTAAEIDWGDLTDTSTTVQYGNETEHAEEDGIDFELDSVDLSAIVVEGGGEELMIVEEKQQSNGECDAIVCLNTVAAVYVLCVLAMAVMAKRQM